MLATDVTGQLERLFADTRRAHRQAFAATDGEDSEWPLWYAEYMIERLRAVLDPQMTRSRLVHCLVEVEDERLARAPEAERSVYYARRFEECFAPPQDLRHDELALYHFDGCPFCARVRRVIDELELDVTLHDIFEDRNARADLKDARGRTTVPVLKITSRDGRARWMPESADIIRYLRQNYADTPR